MAAVAAIASAADFPLNASHPDTRVNMIEYWEVEQE